MKIETTPEFERLVMERDQNEDEFNSLVARLVDVLVDAGTSVWTAERALSRAREIVHVRSVVKRL